MKKLVIIGLSLFIFFACNEKNEEQIEEKVSAKSDMQKVITETEEGIHIVDAWVRPAAMNRNTGVFFRVMNHTSENDTLIKAISTIAEKTEVHETFKQGEDMMGMREVEYLVMEAGKVFVFKPMSYHIMLINLNETLTVGNTIDLTLIFKKAGEVNVKAVVEDKMPTMKAAEEKEKTGM